MKLENHEVKKKTKCDRAKNLKKIHEVPQKWDFGNSDKNLVRSCMKMPIFVALSAKSVKDQQPRVPFL